MRVLLSSNPYRDRGLRVALEARRILNNAGAETALCLPFAPRKGDRLDLPRQVKLGSMEEELKRADVLLCFGGDGTILHAARDATLHDVPILGVNMGSVGFMAELERGELSLLTLLAAGEYRTEERMMLSVRVLRGEKVLSEDLALNDAVISKGSMARVAEMEVRADGVLVTNLMGDGVIVVHPHRFHRLLHVSGRAYRGAHLTGHHRHSCVRPPAVHPVHGAGAGAAGHRPAPPGEPEASVPGGGRGQGSAHHRNGAGGDLLCPSVHPADPADGTELLSDHLSEAGRV